MVVALSKTDLINLVKGTKPAMEICAKFTEVGMMRFSGNQNNENLDWVISELDKLTEDDLWRLYQVYK